MHTIRPRFLAAMLALSACATAAPAMAKPSPSASDRDFAREFVSPRPVSVDLATTAIAHAVADVNAAALDDLDAELSDATSNRASARRRPVLFAANDATVPVPLAVDPSPPPSEAAPVADVPVPLAVDPSSLPLNPASVDAVEKIASAAIASGNWTLVMVLLLLIILFFGERAIAPKFPFLQSSTGIGLITVVLSSLGGLAVALSGGGPLTAAVAVKAIVGGLMTAGAFLSPTVAQAKIARAENAAAAAVKDKPAPGVNGIA